MKTHPCADRGHLWLEVVSGQPFVRHRGRSGLVPVHCQNCDATATLQSHAANVAPAHQKVDTFPRPARTP